MEKRKPFAIAALVLALLPLALLLFIPVKSMSAIETEVIVLLVMEVAAVVCGILGVKASKGMAITGIVVGILLAILFAIALLGFKVIKNATDCVDNGDGTATCQVMGQEMDIDMNMLTEEQIRK